MARAQSGKIRGKTVLFLAGWAALWSNLAFGVQSAADKRAPFTAVRWDGETPQVQVNGTWQVFRSLNDLPAEKILAFCKQTYGRDWQKRFAEDLVEVLGKMGQPPGPTVRLVLRDPQSGAETILPQAPMTAENRRAVMKAKHGDPAQAGAPPLPRVVAPAPPEKIERVRREHAPHPPAAFEPLRKRVRATHEWAAAPLFPQQAADDLDQLEWLLENRYSYLKLKGIDYRGALDALRAGLNDGITRGEFAIQVEKLLALFGDGHSGVRNSQLARALPAGYAPFLPGDARGRVLALCPDGSAFLEEDCPALKSIDGTLAETWLETAVGLVSQGSPQFVRRGALENLRYLNYLRAERGLQPTATVRLELSSLDGAKTRFVELPLAARPAAPPERVRRKTGKLDGNVGYLRIAQMDDDAKFLNGLKAALGEFRDTRGLIIDVRGNGGGARDALRVLFPFFCAPDEPPLVVNVAAYRLGPGEAPNRAEGYLGDRFLYPLTSKLWSPAERKTLEKFAAGFQSEWRPPANEFSAWHYFALGPSNALEYFHYNRPVVVLLDGDCFSATDIFLAALKGRPNITLLGTPSGGGSGRKQLYKLQHSGIEFYLSSMASFRPDGRLYDGRGTEPDVLAEPALTDWIGKTDSVLEAALKRLR